MVEREARRNASRTYPLFLEWLPVQQTLLISSIGRFLRDFHVKGVAQKDIKSVKFVTDLVRFVTLMIFGDGNWRSLGSEFLKAVLVSVMGEMHSRHRNLFSFFKIE